MVIPPLRKMGSNEKKDREGKRNSFKDKGVAFSHVFDEKVDDISQEDISYHVTGYTRDAVPFNTHYQTREYK